MVRPLTFLKLDGVDGHGEGLGPGRHLPGPPQRHRLCGHLTPLGGHDGGRVRVPLAVVRVGEDVGVGQGGGLAQVADVDDGLHAAGPALAEVADVVDVVAGVGDHPAVSQSTPEGRDKIST